MQDYKTIAIKELVRTYGFKGEFLTDKEMWEVTALLCHQNSIPNYNYEEMEKMRNEVKVGENTIESLCENGIIISNKETDDMMFLPYEVLADDILIGIIRIISRSVFVGR